MRYLFIDTNIYMFCSLVSRGEHQPSLLQAIHRVLDNTEARLIVPETVKREYISKMNTAVDTYDRNAQDTLKKMRDTLFASTDKDKVSDTIEEIRTNRMETAARAREYFDQLLTHEKTMLLPLDGQCLARALGYSISGQAPSKGKTAKERADSVPSEPGFVIEPDCLIVASLALYLQDVAAGKDDSLVVCTHNRSDFADFDEGTQQHVLASAISRELPCDSVYYSSLDELLDAEFADARLTPAEKADYADAKEEAAILTRMQATRSQFEVSCPSCDEVVVLSGVLGGPSEPGECSSCGGQFFTALGVDGVPRVRVRLPEKSMSVRCPRCGHSMKAHIVGRSDRPVERWCLRCYTRFSFNGLTGRIVSSSEGEPHPASFAGEDGGRLLIRCPDCARVIRSFAQKEGGETYAICGNAEHGAILLIARDERRPAETQSQGEG